MRPPALDSRDVHMLLEQIRGLAEKYLPAWSGVRSEGDPGARMLVVFSRLMEILNVRLNRMPEKNFMEFLDFVGVKRYPGASGEVPLTFKISSGTDRTTLPKGTQVATVQTESLSSYVFETLNSVDATSAAVKRIFYAFPERDVYNEITYLEYPPEKAVLEDPSQGITLFSEEGLSIPHELYLESEELFGSKEVITITLRLDFEGLLGEGFMDQSLIWEIPDSEGISWVPASVTYLPSTTSQIQVVLPAFQAVTEMEVGGQKGYWLRLRPSQFLTAGGSGSFLKKIDAYISPGTGLVSTALIQSLVKNTQLLDVSKPIYPFGEFPKFGDVLYVRSDEAFTNRVKEVELRILLNAPSLAELQNQFSNLVNSTDIVTEIDWQYPGPDGNWNILARYRHVYSITPGTPPTLSVTREKWDPTLSTWNSIIDEDGTFFAFSGSGQSGFKFEVPSDITSVEVAGEEGGYIRALIKNHNPFGKSAELVANTSFSGPPDPHYLVVGPTLIPPIIEKFDVTFTYHTNPLPVTTVVACENFQWKNLTMDLNQGRSVEVFHPLHLEQQTLPATGEKTSFFSVEPALYIGLDGDFENKYLSFYARILENPFSVGAPTELGNPQIVWEVFDVTGQWLPLKTEDDTLNLTGSGVVSFLGPKAGGKINPVHTTEFFPEEDQALYWIRARLAEGVYTLPPFFQNIYINSVMARQAKSSSSDLILGSGTGEKNQKLQLLKTPVLSGEIWIREPEALSLAEKETLLKDHTFFQPENIPNVIEESNEDSSEVLVRWVEVSNFLTSDANSRHYTLDPVEGVLHFGDSLNGMMPPPLKNNILLRNFQTGGGEKAKAAGTLLSVKELQSNFPFVKEVFNVSDTVGGADGWTREQIQLFGPQSIKNRDKAVSVEDYEWMILQNFSGLARVRCLPTKAPQGSSLVFQPGAVTVLVLPNSLKPEPRPTNRLLRQVVEFLQTYSLANIFNDVYAIGPNFVRVSVDVEAVSENPRESRQVEGLIRDELNRFFHPLSGGEKGEGWKFGRAVPLSEIMASLQKQKGVKFIQSLEFTGLPAVESYAIPEFSLPVTGTHTITMVDA